MSVLDDEAVEELRILIEESTRASQNTSKFFVESAPGVLRRASSRRHHILFGRRGSGKSSLLNQVHSTNLVHRKPSAFVDLEPFKNNAYPDILIGILIRTLKSYLEWLEDAAVKPKTAKKFWSLFTKDTDELEQRKIDKNDAIKLRQEFDSAIKELETQLHLPVVSEVSDEEFDENAAGAKLAAEVKTNSTLASGSLSAELDESITRRMKRLRTYRSNKEEFLQRRLSHYRDLMLSLSGKSQSDVFLIFDDFYHIRLTDQVFVLDYFHQIAKGTQLWLKVGTIRYRTKHYQNGDPPVGMKLEDDASPINLDSSLEQYRITRQFLFNILDQFSTVENVNIDEIFTKGAKDRLVLVSGGVVRDFLTLFNKSIEEAQERILSGHSLEKVSAEDVNRASGKYYDSKLAELDKDTDEQAKTRILDQVQELTNFCLDTSRANVFLVEKDFDKSIDNLMGELVDLKMIHQIRTGVTVSSRPRRKYDAFLLDYTFYTGSRAQRNFAQVEFWTDAVRDDVIRKAGFIYQEE